MTMQKPEDRVGMPVFGKSRPRDRGKRVGDRTYHGSVRCGPIRFEG